MFEGEYLMRVTMMLALVTMGAWCDCAAGGKPLEVRVALFPTWMDADRLPIEFVVRKAFQDLRQQHFLPPQVSVASIHELFGWLPLQVSVELLVERGCDNGEGTRGLAEGRLFRNVSAVLGIPCSSGAKGLGLLAAKWDIPVLSSSAMTTVISDKHRYSTLARVAETSSAIGMALLELLQEMGWSEVGLVGDPAHPYVLDSVRAAFQPPAVQVTVEEHLESDDLREEAMDRALERLRRGARVIVLGLDRLGEDAEVGLNATASFLAQAAKRNMTGPDFVYVVPLGLGAFIGANQLRSRIGRYTVLDGSYPKLSPAILRHVLVHQRTGRSAETIEPFLSRFRNWTLEPGAEELVSGIGAAFERMDWSLLLTMQSYDAAYAYGLALCKCYWDLGCDPYSGRDLMTKVRHLEFAGATGRVIMTANFDREVGYRIYALDPATQRQTQYFEQEIYLANRTQDGNRSAELEHYPARRFVVLKDFVWGTPDGRRPRSMPACGFTGDMCPESVALQLGIGMASAAALIILSALLVFKYRQDALENQILAKSWEVGLEELMMTGREVGASHASENTSLHSSVSKAASEGSVGALLEGTEDLVGFIGLAVLANRPVAVKQYRTNGQLQFRRRTELLELKQLKDLSHENLTGFLGLCLGRKDRLLVVWEAGRQGSLADILANDDVQLDATIRASIIRDVVMGLNFLHESALGVHGELSVDKCVVDSRWMVKLTDYGIGYVLRSQRLKGTVSAKAFDAEKLLHVAPEALRFWSAEFGIAALPTKEADVYALGMVLYQVLTRRPLWDDEEVSSDEVIAKLTGGGMVDYRPTVPLGLAEDPHVEPCAGLLPLVIQCWSGEPENRPKLPRLRKAVGSLSGSGNLVEDMMSVMEKYAGNLEQMVATRTAQVQEEKQRAEDLLGRMLPASVARELKAGRPVHPETFRSTTIYFSDIVGFTAISGRSEPLQVVRLLNYLYSTFDNIIIQYDAYKVETIGDAYMVVSGLPRRNGEAHAAEVGRMALEIRDAVAEMRVPHFPSESLRVRIGLHSGPCAAGVVGNTMPRYCLFGDTVNTASRMESEGEPMRVHVSEATKTLLAKNAPDAFSLAQRAHVAIRGKPQIFTYWLGYSDSKEAP